MGKYPRECRNCIGYDTSPVLWKAFSQQIYVPVEVRSPAGNFDTLGKKIVGDPGVQNQNFEFGISGTLILYARSIFSQGSHLLEILGEKIFFVKTLSKLGALTVYFNF